MPNERQPKLRCFIAAPFSPDFDAPRKAIRTGIIRAGARAVTLDEQPASTAGLIDAIQGELARADCVIADISGRNPNVYYALGLAQAMGKGIFLCRRRDAAELIPSDLLAFQVLFYEDSDFGLSELASGIQQSLRDYRQFPRRNTLIPTPRITTPFIVDWDRLERPEAENLCRELLFQMGYQRVDWAKDIPEFDLIAELPKKDPDGFEYRELWLVAMGRNAPMEMLFEWADHPGYLIHRLLRRSSRLLDRLATRGQGSLPITFLFILLHGEPMSEEFERMRARLYSTKGLMLDGPEVSFPRVRLWDRSYLTTLVQQFPQIGFKYFSDVGRSQSKYRKTPEELYKENIALTEKLTRLIYDLEEEKNKRVRAERDAVWKDISFAAAHKIGNPIFAIETDLDPLQRRIRDRRIDEAIEVTANMRSSVDKAKAIIDQFKSLTRIQEITRTRTMLRPLLDDACRMVQNHGVECVVDCPADLVVDGDPERLAECFDELAVNATHWFDKEKKLLEMHARLASPPSVPTLLEKDRVYVLVHVRDNGQGVSLEDKTRIFDAFFTRHEHGTGLGLALVRRIIEGHGGMVMETGAPGKGADFEIYLPVPRALGENPAKSSHIREGVSK